MKFEKKNNIENRKGFMSSTRARTINRAIEVLRLVEVPLVRFDFLDELTSKLLTFTTTKLHLPTFVLPPGLVVG